MATAEEIYAASQAVVEARAIEQTARLALDAREELINLATITELTAMNDAIAAFQVAQQVGRDADPLYLPALDTWAAAQAVTSQARGLLYNLTPYDGV